MKCSSWTGPLCGLLGGITLLQYLADSSPVSPSEDRVEVEETDRVELEVVDVVDDGSDSALPPSWDCSDDVDDDEEVGVEDSVDADVSLSLALRLPGSSDLTLRLCTRFTNATAKAAPFVLGASFFSFDVRCSLGTIILSVELPSLAFPRDSPEWSPICLFKPNLSEPFARLFETLSSPLYFGLVSSPRLFGTDTNTVDIFSLGGIHHA